MPTLKPLPHGDIQLPVLGLRDPREGDSQQGLAGPREETRGVFLEEGFEEDPGAVKGLRCRAWGS